MKRKANGGRSRNVPCKQACLEEGQSFQERTFTETIVSRKKVSLVSPVLLKILTIFLKKIKKMLTNEKTEDFGDEK